MGVGRGGRLHGAAGAGGRGAVRGAARAAAAQRRAQAVRARQPRVRVHGVRARRVGGAAHQHRVHQGTRAGLLWHGECCSHLYVYFEIYCVAVSDWEGNSSKKSQQQLLFIIFGSSLVQ